MVLTFTVFARFLVIVVFTIVVLLFWVGRVVSIALAGVIVMCSVA